MPSFKALVNLGPGIALFLVKLRSPTMKSFRVFMILTAVGLLASGCAGSDQMGPTVDLVSPAASPAPIPAAAPICGSVGKCANTCMLNYPHLGESAAQQTCPTDMGTGGCQDIINTDAGALQSYQNCVGSIADKISIPTNINCVQYDVLAPNCQTGGSACLFAQYDFEISKAQYQACLQLL